MKFEENKSQIWFKVLSSEGRDLNNEMKKWSLPEGTRKSEWITCPCSIGTWIVSDPKDFMQRSNRAFVVELSEEAPIIEFPGIIWVRKLRLVREATNMDLKCFGVHRAFAQLV